jgi:hypothetical protein
MRIFRTVWSALVLCLLVAASQGAMAQVSFSITVAPPPLPVYAQPPCPTPGYIWTPGYWGYGALGYYWVPGVWVAPPRPAVFWTPGYWGFANGVYAWNAGYWGPHVGYYGGINYGFGYVGTGFVGGMWAGNVYRYNTAVTNVNTSVVNNVYVDRSVVNNTTVVNRASFNGTGGITTQPTASQQALMREERFQPTASQLSHEQAQSQNRYQLASMNHGTPGAAAMDTVDGRRYNQQGRIAQGISSGQLTPAETKNLESREARLNGEIHTDRAANGGKLTGAERQQVNQQQNNLSRSIYQDKHNAATDQYGNNEVGARRNNQQQRIANGVRSGQMAPSEVAKAEGNEQKINRQIAGDRAGNGGKLTPQEHRNVNREQNAESRQIYHEKHNEHVAPK